MDRAVNFLNKATYTASTGMTASSIAGYLLLNKELIFIFLGILGGCIGVLTYLTGLFFQLRREKREQLLFNAESELIDIERRRNKVADTGHRNRKTDTK